MLTSSYKPEIIISRVCRGGVCTSKTITLPLERATSMITRLKIVKYASLGLFTGISNKCTVLK